MRHTLPPYSYSSCHPPLPCSERPLLDQSRPALLDISRKGGVDPQALVHPKSVSAPPYHPAAAPPEEAARWAREDQGYVRLPA